MGEGEIGMKESTPRRQASVPAVDDRLARRWVIGVPGELIESNLQRATAPSGRFAPGELTCQRRHYDSPSGTVKVCHILCDVCPVRSVMTIGEDFFLRSPELTFRKACESNVNDARRTLPLRSELTSPRRLK